MNRLRPNFSSDDHAILSLRRAVRLQFVAMAHGMMGRELPQSLVNLASQWRGDSSASVIHAAYLQGQQHAKRHGDLDVLMAGVPASLKNQLRMDNVIDAFNNIDDGYSRVKGATVPREVYARQAAVMARRYELLREQSEAASPFGL